jgi:mono/diheme cytochrome c family protein
MRYISGITALWLAFAALGGGSAAAQSADVGHDIYMQYCATCHGEAFDGRGPLTELMTVQVADLTQLSANNDGAFPMLKVIHIIDGRTGLRGHGGPMPTYGRIFTDETAGEIGNYGAVLATRGRILSLALYLESIQK